MVDRLTQRYAGRIEVRGYNLDRGEGEKEYAEAGGRYVPMFVLRDSAGRRVEAFYGEIAEEALAAKLERLE